MTFNATDTVEITTWPRFQYASYRDRAGLPAWLDCQTRRYISRSTLMTRTGLSREHILSFENGRDGRGYRQSRETAQAERDRQQVILF